MSENLTVKERFLDFSECSYIGEVYAVIKKELELPEWCGENLDALWDAVTGMMYTPANITIKTATKKTALQQSVNDIVTVFHEAEEEYGMKLASTIQMAIETDTECYIRAMAWCL